jgi:hypothetical protein
MSNQYLKLRRSAVPGKVPTTSSIDFGEIALNTYDGLAFMKKSGSNGEEIVTLGAGSALSGGLINRIPIWTSTGSLGNSDIFQTGSFISLHYTGSPEDPGNPELLYVHGGEIPTYNLISAHGNLDNYVQINIKNYSTGSSASGDIVVTADNGNENDKYVDLGINSSGFTNTSYVGGANDAYLYSRANDFYIGNASTGSQLILFNGGYDADANARVWIFDQGTIGINTNDYNNVNPPSLQIKAPNSSTYNLVQIEGNVDNYSQVGIVNRNHGTNASADLALYNDIDPDRQLAGFIDIGINSTNYITNSFYPGDAGHAYVFTDSHNLIIGTTSGKQDELNLFVGGANADINSKLKLRANNIHSLTGSLNATQGFTGSLYGTASWAISASWAPLAATSSYASSSISSSYATTASYAITATNATSASYVIQAISASYATVATTATTASYVLNAISSSYATNATIATTASYVLNAISSSYSTNATTATTATTAQAPAEARGFASLLRTIFFRFLTSLFSIWNVVILFFILVSNIHSRIHIRLQFIEVFPHLLRQAFRVFDLHHLVCIILSGCFFATTSSSVSSRCFDSHLYRVC